jgi:hypothetical protein
MVGLEGELGLVLLLGTEPVEPFNARAAVGAVDPLARRSPLELSPRRLLRERLAGIEQRLGIHTVVN